MLRSHLEFAFVLFIVFVSSALSVSFGDFCSHDFICQQPLVCSNESQCMCPTDTSFWSSRQNSCLSCPSGWTEWKEEKCVMFVAPSSGGVTYEEARSICLAQSAELLEIADHEGFVKFENEMKDLANERGGRALIEFLSNGVWIDSTSKSAHVDREHTNENHQERIFDVIGGLVSNLLFPTPATPAPTQAPQLIYVTNPTQQILPLSFGDFCSHDFICQQPLVCSNESQCMCPTDTSFWSSRQNSCLSCPSGWTEWKEEKCVMFVAPSSGGVTYEEARSICSSQSAELLEIADHEGFVKFENEMKDLVNERGGRALIEFLNNGVWISFTGNILNRNIYKWWCDPHSEYDASPRQKCMCATRPSSKNDSIVWFCLNHANCNESLPYICEKLADPIVVHNETTLGRAWAALIGPALNLVGSLFGSNQQPPPQPQRPEIQIITAPSESKPQAAASDDNTILYIVLAVVAIIIIVTVIIFCFCGGGLLYICTNKNSSVAQDRSRPNRTSVDSVLSTISR
ncbi:unnamed protein product [Adineta ricciae]|uniref:C-type lectin domain-containing protein n=1 Tax=Adineta ricciae TaxID=249248 RepID=A0A814M8R6_ADIRI|nr:unnamed protein product [Adineta ricciae]